MKKVLEHQANKKMPDPRKQGGFTIVEFMIATAVFSLVLLVCAYAIVYVGRMFYKGMITNRTQDTARQLVEDIASAVQFGVGGIRSGNATRNGVAVLSLCIGDRRYSYVSDRSQGASAGQVRHVLWQDRLSSSTACIPVDITQATPPDSEDGRDLLGENMRLPHLLVESSDNGIWRVEVRVAYGEDISSFTDSDASSCVAVLAGGQFCAVSNFSTSVTRRL